ncbi:isopeptide-forming domain-containing fimbrial protein [Clostridium botulinum]|nr:isopeptide-forming domain-containing fimbrial protein [Clostridium botulinum]
MPSNPIVMIINNTENVPIIVGGTSSFNINIQNTSTDTRFYNLSLSLTLPNGLTLSSSTIAQTSTVSNLDNSTSYYWTNLKDLAPLEINYNFNITVKCNSTFKNGSSIPFGYTFSNINVQCQVDTMPRGIYDAGNQQLTTQTLMSFLSTMFNGIITTSGKVLKGAGTSISLNDYTQVNTATCQFFNNSLLTSSVNISILLDDGIRYLSGIVVTGTDASQFNSPIVNTVVINNKQYTQLYYGGITLSTNSNTTLKFNYAVWNQYNNNQGNFIAHGTKLNMSVNMSSSSYSLNNSFTFSAMDLIISTSVSKSLVDVQNNLTFSYNYKVGQYYDIKNIIVYYYLPDGIYYLSSSYVPSSVINNSTIQGYYITYNFPLALRNSVTTVNISAKVNSYYQYKFDSNLNQLPVVSFDSFNATTNITGTTVSQLNVVTDSSNTSCSINIGSIQKQFIKAYYRDGTPKTINTLAPFDFAQYTLTYTATNLNAMQKQIYIDDFFPLSADPINNLNYIYTGYQPIASPQLISPHGVDFYYGDIPGKSSSIIDFKVPINSLGTPSQNINLMKLRGINTLGFSYSSRSQVLINIGNPNLQLIKSVSGPNTSSIKAGEIYSYTVKITNTNTLGTETDAFNFTLTDTLSSWFTLNPNSINVSGSGIYSSYQFDNNNVYLYINKLSPGQSLTLTYNVTISSVISPGVNISTTATNTNPYSQIYNSSLNNFQYTGLIKSASTTISSSSITLTKTTNNDVFKVGSPIIYTITLTIPLGTIAYNVSVRDTLSNGNQIYNGSAFRNGISITPSVSSNVINFPSEGTIDSRTSKQTIVYTLYCKINNGSKSINATTSTQNNSYQCFYSQISGGNISTISKSLSVTINHPNILMNLTCTDKTSSIVYNQTVTASISSVLQFKLSFQNNSAIDLVNGTIQIPINSNFTFSSIDTTTQCTGSYNSSTNKIIILINTLPPSTSGVIIFTLLPKSNLTSGTSITTVATATSYYNNILLTKIYSGETSNTLTTIFSPGTSLLPNPLTKINDSTSFIVTQPGNTATIINYFNNTGGGYDSYTLSIQPVALAYSLYIDNSKIIDVPANTSYTANLDVMKNLSPNTSKTITITSVIPLNQPLGSRYDFIVTTTSLTNPYPSKTVLNIDPS